MLAMMVSASTGNKQGNKKVTPLRPMVAAKTVQVLKRSEKCLIGWQETVSFMSGDVSEILAKNHQADGHAFIVLGAGAAS